MMRGPRERERQIDEGRWRKKIWKREKGRLKKKR
jgi:hypothetical protein